MPKLIFTIIFVWCALFAGAQYDKPYADSLQARLDTTRFDTVRVRCLIKLGLFYLHDQPKRAEKLLLRAYEYPLKTSPDEQGYRAVAAKGIFEAKQTLGDITAALEWLKKARHFASRTHEPMVLDMVYDQFSIYYRDNDKFDSALFYAQKMVQVWDSLKKPQNLPPAYYTISNLFLKMGQRQRALSYLHKTETTLISTKGNDAPELLSVYSSMADILAMQKQYDSVLHYCNLAYPIMIRESAADDLTELLALRSDAEWQLGRYVPAMTSAREGLALATSLELVPPRFGLYKALATAKASLQEKDSAFYYAKEAEKYMATNVGSKMDTVVFYAMWANIHTALGNFKEALTYREKEIEAFTAFKEDELAAITARNEVQFETAKKEKTIEELNEVTAQQRKIQWLIGGALLLSLVAAVMAYRNYLIKKKLAVVLEQSNAEKETFLKEIHHRVKNNLQIISSLLYMQFKDTKDEKMLAQLKQAQSRIKSMALVHNKLYETKHVVHVFLLEYIKDLANNILSSNTPSGKEINLHLEQGPELSLSLDASISVGLILNELITNSCKYAFEHVDKGNIFISVQRTDKGIHLRVKDDGSGLPQQYEPGKTLGLKLVKNLARQLGGRAELASSNGLVADIYFQDEIAA